MTTVTLNGSNYSIPAYGDTGWAVGTGNLSSYLVAIASGTLQTTGGTFALSANVNFGASYGLLAAYFSTRAASPATSGLIRLALTDTIKWGAANLALSVTGTDLYWNGNRLLGSGSVVSIAEGGTGASNAQDAITALAGSQVSGRYLRSDGTHTALSAIQAGDVPTLNQNTSGTAANATNAVNATTAAACSGNTAGTAANITGVCAIANGGTGQITAPLAIAALLPVPTRQVLTSGTAYTTPTNARQLKILMVGGGGGGGGASSGAGAGGTGGTTSFNSITAVGGTGGNLASNSVWPAGGAGGAGGTGTAFRIAGNPGTGGNPSGINPIGQGGSTMFGGAGKQGGQSNSPAPVAAIANSGSGGSSTGDGSYAGGGGGAGEYVEFIISSPSASYTYAIGAGGAAGASTGGCPGGAGGSGIIIVDETY